MREYVTPRMTGETFAANEYIAACWGVACVTDSANTLEEEFYHNPVQSGITHDPNYCGQTTHQWIIDSDNDNVAESMVEINTNGLGSLPCTIYYNERYWFQRDISTVKSGDYIYWTTSSGDRVWHHQGRVTDTVPGHPNRS